MIVALRNLTVKRNDQIVNIKPGDSIPEAEYWENKEHYIRRGWIKVLDREEKEEVKKVKKVKKTVKEDKAE